MEKKNSDRIKIQTLSGNFKCSSELCQLCCQDYMRTGKFFFHNDGMRLYTLRDKLSCNAVNVVYQITCARCKQRYIGERLSSAYEFAQV